MNKITFVTFHNWDTKRQGGFHKFAEAACMAGIETVFFSFARPYYIGFKKDERLNRKVLKTLMHGIRYPLGKSELLNITWPTLALPNPFFKWIPHWLNRILKMSSLSSFQSFAHKNLKGTNCFVFESCEGILLIDKIKVLFPKAKIVYRPSDPLMIEGSSLQIFQDELKMLRMSDLVLLVNQESLDLYKKRIPNFEMSVRFEILSNGVDLQAYSQGYPVPELFKERKTALYVGARDIEWTVVFDAARAMPEVNFIVVSPSKPNLEELRKVRQYANLSFIPGISPHEIPAWVTNCNVVIVPNPRNRYRIFPWGITAKYYQAMAAQKPIVAYHDTDRLRNIGIAVTYNSDEFIKELKKALKKDSFQSYEFNLDAITWEKITNHFLYEIECLFKE